MRRCYHIAVPYRVPDDLGNSTILALSAQVDEKFGEEAEKDELRSGEDQKDPYQEERAITDPLSLEPTNAQY
jgi:hypothetical protein